MNLKTKVFLKKKFKEYHWKNRVPAPPEIYRREFGVGTLDDKIKFRHRSFKNEREFQNYLRVEAPFFISCSSAYYEFPANQPMDAKGWLGADLVFDLDSEMDFLSRGVFDHVKNEALNLIDFLLGDFGLHRKDIEINFSGSKGYHIHVRRDDVRRLGGDERREIVDYVTGTGLELDCFMRETVGEGAMSDRNGKYTKMTPDVIGPRKGDMGWASRIYDATHDVIVSQDVNELRKIQGIGEKTAGQLVCDRDKNIKSLSRGKWGGLLHLTRGLQKRIIEEKAIKLTGDADRMVTIDTSRLMRVPDTLHGGTGLKAAKVRDIEKFDPLNDAVVFSDEKTRLVAIGKIPGFEMKNEKFGPYQPGEAEVPEFVAVYLLLKRVAELSD